MSVVKGGDEPELARRYVDGLRKGPCAAALQEAGFGPAPGEPPAGPRATPAEAEAEAE